jgi:penicillin-binding protein 1C
MAGAPTLIQPTPDLHLARDPRIPDNFEAFAFELDSATAPRSVEWYVDGSLVGTTAAGERRFAWPLVMGKHVAHARVWIGEGEQPVETERIAYVVK